MKKLNLQLNSIKEMLTKEQMKKIVGGYGGEEIHQCMGNGQQYTCNYDQVTCAVVCSDTYGTGCGGCS